MFGLAVFFCISQSFTLSKTVRDWQLADMPGFGQAKFIRGSNAWYFQVWTSFVVATGLSFYLLSSVASESEWSGDGGFFVIATAFALSATLALAKAVRDRSDAAVFEELNQRLPAGVTRREVLQSITATCRGTSGNTLATFVSFVLSVFLTLHAAHSMEEFSFERFVMTFIPLLLWMMYSSFMLAKLIRDTQDPDADHGNHPAYKFMVYISFALSIAFAFGFVHVMELSLAKTRFLYTGLLFVLASVLSFAKLVRDKQELAAKLKAQ